MTLNEAKRNDSSERGLTCIEGRKSVKSGLNAISESKNNKLSKEDLCASVLEVLKGRPDLFEPDQNVVLTNKIKSHQVNNITNKHVEFGSNGEKTTTTTNQIIEQFDTQVEFLTDVTYHGWAIQHNKPKEKPDEPLIVLCRERSGEDYKKLGSHEVITVYGIDKVTAFLKDNAKKIKDKKLKSLFVSPNNSK